MLTSDIHIHIRGCTQENNHTLKRADHLDDWQTAYKFDVQWIGCIIIFIISKSNDTITNNLLNNNE